VDPMKSGVVEYSSEENAEFYWLTASAKHYNCYYFERLVARFAAGMKKCYDILAKSRITMQE
jgi:hypothetical protein